MTRQPKQSHICKQKQEEEEEESAVSVAELRRIGK